MPSAVELAAAAVEGSLKGTVEELSLIAQTDRQAVLVPQDARRGAAEN